MNKLLIKGGRLLSSKNGYSFDKLDILIENGIIKVIGNDLEENGIEILKLNGEIIAPGFIDIHTHCYKGKSPIGTEADLLGIERGSTTIFDAGTSGPLNYMDFKENVINKVKTKVFTCLNISDYGLDTLNELSNLESINEERVLKVVNENRDNIKAIKVRASASVVGKNGLKPIAIGKEIARKVQLPLVVHMGNYPPSASEVLNLLDKNDIVTHSYHGKKNGLFKDDGTLKDEVIEAKKRGVKFDVGHGSASFNIKIFKKALKNNLIPDFISTDLYHTNMVEPVGSILNVINKLISAGLTLEECIQKVTSDVADFFNLEGIGELKEGYIADLTIFNIKPCDEIVKDSEENEQKILVKLELGYVVHTGGNGSGILKFNKK
ncbi:amidohydrolase family protein [Clostridium weizhouense]|uniref:Amidohydrolase/deacetylase family metallohydrolase n=1 Tax=Clostridium weizhouense TaxID=2859781 RepID=A0ABS7AN92_9CLOT|nr:amidohydrolase/deacetylase family metallohydrolase [Clostridium weizhouense]MBW6410112.1 amidohydrolase/deacetylase family metallohydrolase [Clostridium weizhouense]